MNSLKHFINKPIDPQEVKDLLSMASLYKNNPLMHKELGKGKTIGLVFFNPSLRTRLSTQKAAYNLGMEVLMLNVYQDGWGLETQNGVVMNGKSGEHIKEGIPVLSEYCDMIGVRSFAKLEDRIEDEKEIVINAFIKYSSVPIINLESCQYHPLQSLADKLTIQEYSNSKKPKVVLTWAPHVKCLPQAVANSFLEWMQDGNVDLVLTHPPGYELSKEFVRDCEIDHDQNNALKDADFVYCKNWSSYQDYGKNISGFDDWMITNEKMKKTNNAKFMHCLPVRRNVVVEDSVLDSESSIVIPQASNRVWAAQAVLGHILGGGNA